MIITSIFSSAVTSASTVVYAIINQCTPFENILACSLNGPNAAAVVAVNESNICALGNNLALVKEVLPDMLNNLTSLVPDIIYRASEIVNQSISADSLQNMELITACREAIAQGGCFIDSLLINLVPELPTVATTFSIGEFVGLGIGSFIGGLVLFTILFNRHKIAQMINYLRVQCAACKTYPTQSISATGMPDNQIL